MSVSSDPLFQHDERMIWVALSTTPGIGIRRIHSLIQRFGNVRNAWLASAADMAQANVPAEVQKNLDRQRMTFDPAAVQRRVESAGARIIAYPEAEYPAVLRTLPDAPPVLYVRGALLPGDNRALAVVGTRRATAYGRDVTRSLVTDLARAGLTIVSGLAQGIDAAAHSAALDCGGRTIAVLGCGIDRVYPNSHADLARRITTSGAVITEFAVGKPPDASNFPRRNRIISGLAMGVLVVEAPADSGALITAKSALEQGREVFAVPGSIFNASSAGTNALISDGARLVTDSASVLEGLFGVGTLNVPPPQTPAAPMGDAAQLNDEQIALLRAFKGETIQIDELVRSTGQPAAFIMAMLSALELEGWVEPEQGGIYRISRAALHILNTLH